MSSHVDNLSPHHTVEPTACYWNVLDVSVLPRRHRSDSQRLGFLFEASLPCAIDELHAVYRSASQDRMVGCAIARERIEELFREQAGTILSLTPAALPEFIREETLEPRIFNLLTGAFEPIPLRRLRRQWLLTALFVAAAVGVLLTIGLERRRLVVERHTEELRQDNRGLIAQALGPATGPSSLPAEQRLISTLRRLEQTRSLDQPPTGDSIADDLVQSLFSLLEAWPAEVHAQTESISITPESLTIRGILPSSGDVQALADALEEIEGWSVRQPQVSSTRDGIQAMLTLAPTRREEQNR